MNGRRVGRMLLLMLSVATLACQNPQQPPLIFEIPEGYRGWVSVRFFQPDCPLLPTEGEKQVVRVPASGRLCTGTPLLFGQPETEFYFVDPSGTRTDATGLVHREHVAIEGAAPDKRIYERFFVGTAEELDRTPEPRLE